MSDQGMTPEQYEALFGQPQPSPPGPAAQTPPPPPPGASVPATPQDAPPQPGYAPIQPSPPPKKKRRWLALMLGLMALGVVGCGALVAIAVSLDDSGDDEPREDIATSPSTSGQEPNDLAGSDEPAGLEESTITEEPEPPNDEPELGTREEPFALGSPTTVTWETFGDADGSVWKTTIGELVDLTEAVLENNEFNDPPPDGVVFAGFDVEMTLIDAQKVPLSQGFNFGWEIVGGSTNAAYDTTTIETASFGCGVTPNAWDLTKEVFLSGTIAGTVCIPIPAEDLTNPETAVAMTLGDRVFFRTDGTSPPAEAVPPPADEFTWTEATGARSSPFSYETDTPIEFQSFGDADGSVWTVSIAAPADITSAVLAANQFNEPPPEGAVFAGFEVSMTLDEAEKEPLSPGFNMSFQLAGGATAAVYGELTLSGITGCGVTGGEFGRFDEVFVGGTLSGVVCIPIPLDDLEHPNTRVAIKNVDDTRVYFG